MPAKILTLSGSNPDAGFVVGVGNSPSPEQGRSAQQTAGWHRTSAQCDSVRTTIGYTGWPSDSLLHAGLSLRSPTTTIHYRLLFQVLTRPQTEAVFKEHTCPENIRNMFLPTDSVPLSNIEFQRRASRYVSNPMAGCIICGRPPPLQFCAACDVALCSECDSVVSIGGTGLLQFFAHCDVALGCDCDFCCLLALHQCLPLSRAFAVARPPSIVVDWLLYNVQHQSSVPGAAQLRFGMSSAGPC